MGRESKVESKRIKDETYNDECFILGPTPVFFCWMGNRSWVEKVLIKRKQRKQSGGLYKFKVQVDGIKTFLKERKIDLVP